MVEPPRYPLTADLAGVLATARQERAGEFGRPLASLWRLVRRPAAEPPLDTATLVR
jgi:hypothetical protein